MHRSRIALMLTLVMVAGTIITGWTSAASAHHRDGHNSGKPSASPTPTASPSPSPSPSPTPSAVNVRLEVQASAGINLQAGRQMPVKTCSVVVPGGATGQDVLNAAVAAGCIRSYQAAWSTPPGGSTPFNRLRCLDGICDNDVPSFVWWSVPWDLDYSWATEGAVFEAYYGTSPCVFNICV